MILIADSGSTKTHWRLITSEGISVDFYSQGLNPFFAEESDFFNAVNDTFPENYKKERVNQVYFYGSGCASSEKSMEVDRWLRQIFANARVEVHSDILAAARSLFGSSSGMVVILGSGTNVGFYNGKEVKHETPSLGYLLGDEGSGAYLGKKLVQLWFYNELPADLAAEFKIKYDLTLPYLLKKVYSEPFPNRFLAEFVSFYAEHADHPFIQRIVELSFNKLLKRHLSKYTEFPEYPIGVVGSVGYTFKTILKKQIETHHGQLDKVVQFPMDGLTLFYKTKSEF